MRENRNNCAAKLSVGDWYFFAVVNQTEDNQVWLGRIMSNPAWGGQGVRQNTTRGIHSYSNKTVKIGRNEVALNIMWYEAIGVGSESIEYQSERLHITSLDTMQLENSRYVIFVARD